MNGREATEPAPEEPTEVLEPILEPTLEPTEVLEPNEAEEWPVAELYRPPETPEPPESGALVVTDANDGAPPPPRRRIPSPGAGLAGAIALAVLAIGLGAWLLTRNSDEADAGTTSVAAETSPEAAPPAAQPDPATAGEVPEVVGLRLSNARAVLGGAGFEIAVERQSSERPPGEVLEQKPQAGRSLESGGTVRLTVSRAPMPVNVRVDVPDVVSLPVDDAAGTVRSADLRAEIRLVPSNGEPGTVVEQEPSAGSEVRQGSLVVLSVARSRTPTVERVEVPDVVGSTVSEGRHALRASGLRVSVTQVPDEAPAGTVVGQTPRASSTVREGATVRLRVSTGPRSVTVPDVLGLDEVTARAELEAAGFVVRVSEEPTEDPANDGVVLRQSPTGGSSGDSGQVVTIVLGLYS